MPGIGYQKWMSSTPSVSVGITTSGVLGTADLRAAAELVADGARAIAAGWGSTRIPPAIRVEVAGNMAIISCDAPPAYPNEVKGVRHPVFAHGPRDTWHWVPNQYRPFLGPAADALAGAAMARYSRRIDTMCREAGFR
jgi:hypothetical protein